VTIAEAIECIALVVANRAAGYGSFNIPGEGRGMTMTQGGSGVKRVSGGVLMLLGLALLG